MIQAKKIALVSLFTVALALASLFGNMPQIDQAQVGNIGNLRRTSLELDTNATSNRLADGCHHVFLDVGANVGVHGRFLFEPEIYNETMIAGDIFNQEFGTRRDNRDFCVFAFEPNPAHKQRLEQVSAVYKAMGWRYEFIPAGIGDKDGNMTFYHLHDERFNEWGFTTMRDKDPIGFPGQEEHIPVIRLARWLQEEVHNRVAPSKIFGEYNSSEPKVVMKFDVEGLEFVVLPDLLVSGALCNTVDFVFGEFHYQDFFYPLKFPENDFILRDSVEARTFADHAVKMMQISRSCKTRYDTRDDESYLKDGKPLPQSATSSSHR